MKLSGRITSLISVLFFCSCENFDWFRTDSGINNQIQGTWKREFLGKEPAGGHEENWIFQDGKLFILNLKNNLSDTVNKGNFSVDAKATVSYLKISDLQGDTTLNNNKWTIVQLDDKVLYIVADDANGSAIHREFLKK